MKYRGWIVVLLAIFFSLSATATETEAAETESVVGTWTLQAELDGQSSEVTLTLEHGKDGLTGTWVGPRATHELKEVTWDGQELKFSWKVRRKSVEGIATLTENGLQGTLDTPKGEGSFTGQRAGQ